MGVAHLMLTGAGNLGLHLAAAAFIVGTAIVFGCIAACFREDGRCS